MALPSESDANATNRLAEVLTPPNDSRDASDAIRPGKAVGTTPDRASPTSPCSPAVRTVKLVKGDNGRFDFAKGTQFANNLPLIVGFLEFGNAGDFAANVWNEVPVPLHAVVLMAIGGTVALIISMIAFRDFRLARRNVRFLSRQRREQKAERQRLLASVQSVRDIDVFAAVTFRELGSEIISRLLVDMLLGFGGILISIGTYMAIGGANKQVWFISNIFSGYLGNSPMAINGLVNSFWAAYIFSKAQENIKASQNVLKGSKAAALIKRRGRQVQVFCVINGTATIVGGVGSMLTATYWWAYVIITPVFITSVFCNIWWRKRVGYTRSKAQSPEFPTLIPSNLVTTLEFAARAREMIQENSTYPLNQFVTDPSSLPTVLMFLQECGLFDKFCLHITADQDICDSLGGCQNAELNIGLNDLLALPEQFHTKLLEMAQVCVRDVGAEHFTSHERYTAELLGTFLHIAGDEIFIGGEAEKRNSSA